MPPHPPTGAAEEGEEERGDADVDMGEPSSGGVYTNCRVNAEEIAPACDKIFSTSVDEGSQSGDRSRSQQHARHDTESTEDNNDLVDSRNM